MISLTVSREDWRTGSIPELPLLRKQKFKAKKGASMAEKKTYEPLDELLESTGMKYSAIAEKSNIDKSYLYRLRKKPSKLDGELILRISKATGIDKNKLFDISYFFATKVDKLQQKAS